MRHVVSVKLANKMSASTAPLSWSFIDSKASQQFVGGKPFLDMPANDYNDFVNWHPNAVVEL
tara:strand:- start:267 stop:452 length:186 start_codon:yes stop_codon:yes gene_type:complete